MKKNYFKKTVLLFGLLTFYTVYAIAQCGISGIAATYPGCDTNKYTLVGTPPGGAFSGPGVLNGKFCPANAGPGTHTVSYSNTSSYTYSQVGVFSPVGGAGTLVSLSDDQVSSALPIGFSFNFYNANYTQFYISSNGFIGFSAGMAHGCCGGVFIPNAGSPNNYIAPAWDDLYPPGGGTINYFTTGVAPNRQLVVNFLNLPWCCGGAAQVTTQIVLNESSLVIEIHTTMANVSPGVMGVENSTGTVGTAATGRNASSWNISNDYSKFVPACIASQIVTVRPLPIATLAPFNNTPCAQGQPVVLTGGLPLGGIYSGQGVLNGILNPIIAGAGTHTITYTYTDNDGCIGTATQLLTILPAPTVTFMAMANACKSATPFALFGGVPVGGTYSGPGVNAGIFNPVAAGVGTHTITYSYVGLNGCTGYSSQTITVTTPVVTFNAITPMCLSSPSIVLIQGTPNGGSYSGTGVVNSFTFDPMVSGAGTFNVLYTYTNNTGCIDTVSQFIKVNPLPVVTYIPQVGICKNAPPFTLTGGSPIGGVYSGIGVSNGMFNPQVVGAGQVTYTHTDGLTGCSNSNTQTIIITPVPGVAGTISGTATVCQGQQSVTYSIPAVVGANSYNWVLPPGSSIVAGNNTDIITVDFANNSITGLITVSVNTACGNGAISPSYSVTVNPLPIANYTYTTNAGVGTFSNTSQNATSFVWNFGDGSPNSIAVSPLHVFAGNAIYTVILTATNSCGSDSTSQPVVSVSGVGIAEQSEEQKIAVYPNPTNGLLTILFENKNSKTLDVKLVSADGKLIFAEHNNTFTGTYSKNLNLNNNAKGIYFIQFVSDKEVSVQKIILE